MVNHVIYKSIEGMKEWVSGIEKFFTEFIYRPNILKIINGTKKSITFQHETISGFPASIYKFVPGQSKRSIIFPNILFYYAKKENNNIVSSNLVDKSSHLLLYRNLFLNKILQNTALNPQNITLSGGALNNQNLIYSNNIQNIKSLIFGPRLKNEQNISSKKENIETYSGLIDQSSHLLLYRNLFLNKILQNTALNPQNITLSIDALFNQIHIYGNNSQIRKIGHKTILPDFRTTGKYYSSQNKNFGGNNLFENDSAKYSITFIQPVNKKDSIKNSSNSFSSISMQRRDVQNNDNFYFQNHKQIDQKIEQIKKISQEAKEIVAQKFISGSSAKSEMQPEIDINRLSNKVYKMIEYNMKIEKERRGYL